MADPLIGKFFTSYTDSKRRPGERDILSNGQVRSRVKEGMYLVKLMNAVNLVLLGIVSLEKQVMVSLDDMKGWEFFDSREAWAESYAEYAKAMDAFERTQRDTHYTASGSSPGTGVA